MCPSSLVRELQGPDPPEVYAVKTDQGTFGFAQDVPTVLPGLLADLATYRKTAKREMVEAKGRGDAFAESLLNAKQLAYKVCMNSVYGFFGAAQGYLPCLPLAASVTATGRAMIERTRDLVCELCPGAEVVYGDTDSVMVRLPGPEDMRSQFEEGEKLAATISASFPPPIELEFEKVYMPYCLYGKKRYAGARCFFFPVQDTAPDAPRHGHPPPDVPRGGGPGRGRQLRGVPRARPRHRARRVRPRRHRALPLPRLRPPRGPVPARLDPGRRDRRGRRLPPARPPLTHPAPAQESCSPAPTRPTSWRPRACSW